ncbi:hypothetical protein KQI65_13320 [bacterium]|nr:hypothetical protein [bacterium]
MRHILVFLVLLTGTLHAQPRPPYCAEELPGIAADASQQPVSVMLEMKGYGTGKAVQDNTQPWQSQLALPPAESVYSKKSPFLAGLFSAVIPGAGELYAESYWLAGLFAAIEGGLWYYSIDQNSKGDDQTGVFESYADQHWSVVKYAEWLNENAKDFEGGENAVHIAIDPDESLPPWQRVDWDAMHTTELAVPVFSHKLPPHGDQQYFELIGKYDQYSYGWDDKVSGYYRDPSSNFLYYADLRGQANDFYNTADTIVNLIILNHLLSAIDAAWAAARFNDFVDLYAHAQLLRLPGGQAELQTLAQFSVRF